MFNVYALATEFQGKWENAVVISVAHTVNNSLNCSRKVKPSYDVQFKGSSITRTDEKQMAIWLVCTTIHPFPFFHCNVE